MLEDFEDIPGLEVPAKANSNPYNSLLKCHKLLGPIFRLQFPDKTSVIYLADREAISRVLTDSEGQFTKGPTTVYPFQSLVPLHLISLPAGPEQLSLRSAAVKAISQKHLQQRCFPIVKTQARILSRVLQNSVDRSVDSCCRAFSLDVITEALFGTSWGAQLENSEHGNRKAASSLARIMEVLHWRVLGMDTGSTQVDEHLKVLDARVALEVC